MFAYVKIVFVAFSCSWACIHGVSKRRCWDV